MIEKMFKLKYKLGDEKCLQVTSMQIQYLHKLFHFLNIIITSKVGKPNKNSQVIIEN